MNRLDRDWIRRLSESPSDHRLRDSYGVWLAERGLHGEAELIRLAAEQARLDEKSAGREGPGVTAQERSRFYEVRERLAELSEDVDQHWLTSIDPELAVPPGLSVLGLQAVRVILDFLADEGWTYSGSGRAFSTPAEFLQTHPGGSHAAVLIVSHSDGVLYEALSFVPGHDDRRERLLKRLAAIGVWTELWDEFTSSVYPDEHAGYAIGLDWIS